MNINTKKTNKSIGNFGEKTACDFLKKQGYKIIETNYHYSKLAEIDIIAKEKNTIIFVEVKTRSTTNFGHPFEAINYNKLQKILQAGLYYLQNTKEKYTDYRIDIISILGTENPKIEHLKNVSLN
jgi:putative endonuclease